MVVVYVDVVVIGCCVMAGIYVVGDNVCVGTIDVVLVVDDDVDVVVIDTMHVQVDVDDVVVDVVIDDDVCVCCVMCVDGWLLFAICCLLFVAIVVVADVDVVYDDVVVV